MTDALSFAGRTVVITGGGGALGRAYALDIAARGGKVVVNDLGGSVAGEGSSSVLAEAVVTEITAAGGTALADAQDVSDPAGAAALIAAALAAYGRVDAVIASAGNMRAGPFETLTAHDLNSLYAAHLRGSFNIAQAVWPRFKAQGGGRIVFTASSAGAFGFPGLAGYGAVKGGIIGLTHCLAEEGQQHGILCNALLPNAASRMAGAGSTEVVGKNRWAAAFPQTFDPGFTAGLASYLAHETCQSTHAIYSALGGRIARVVLAATQGWYGSIERPPSAEEVAANFAAVCDQDGGFAVPANAFDEFRIVAERRAQ